MNWSNLWISIFGTTEWAGINIGFWLSMSISLLITIIMNVVFWSMKPYKKINSTNENSKKD